MSNSSDSVRGQRDAETQGSPIRHNRPYVLGINGSPSPNSTTERLLRDTLAAAEESGAEVVLVHARDYVNVFHDGRRDEDLPMEERINNLPSEGLKQIVRLIFQADGVIWATPVNGMGPHARISTLMHWLFTTIDSPEYALAGKVAGLMAVCEIDGASMAMAQMREQLAHLGFDFPSYATHYYYNKSAVGNDEEGWMETDKVLPGRNVVRRIRVNRGEIKPGNWNDPSNSW